MIGRVVFSLVIGWRVVFFFGIGRKIRGINLGVISDRFRFSLGMWSLECDVEINGEVGEGG